MKIAKAICGLALSLIAHGAATVGPPEPMAWRFAHAEAQILAGVDLRKLAQTPDGAQIRGQFVAALGAPLLDQAERLLLSSVFDAGGKRSDILVLSGSFSLPQLRKMAMGEGARMVSYKGLDIAAPPGATAADPHVAWITGPGGGTTVLIGTRPAIQAAAERSKAQMASLASVNPLFARALDLSPQYSVWVTCDTVPRGFGPKALDRYMGAEPTADVGPVEGFDAGIRADSPREASFWVWAADEAAAQQVLSHFRDGAVAKERFVLASWLSELKATVDGSTLVMGTTLAAGSMAAKVGPLLAAFALPVDVKPPVAVAQKVEIRAKVEANVPMSGVAAPAPPPPPPPAPKPLFVRIQGLDAGTKDIPYTVQP